MEFYKKTSHEVLAELDTDESGLSDQEVSRRLDINGPNQIKIKGVPLWRKLAEPFMDVFSAVLIGAVIMSVWHHDYIDAIIIAAIILASAIIYYVQSFSAERVLRSLKSNSKQLVDVVRAGQTQTIDKKDLVPGDIIILTEGNKIPADARLIKTSSLRIDESQLTGESLPIDKHINKITQKVPVYKRSNMVFQGSFVIGGSGYAVVVRTGNRTEFGKIAELSSTPNTASPVQKKIDSLITKIIFITIAISVVALLLSLYQGMSLYESLRFVIALAVGAVPEGLPIAISVVLVLGMRRMASKKTLVRTMRSIETLGTITTIATDKTGTLTENKLSVKSLWHDLSSQKTLLNSMRNSLNLSGEKTHDPLDTAIKSYLVDDKKLSVDINPADSFPFNQKLSMSGSGFYHGEKFRLYIKGAPEKIVENSNLSEAEREKVYAKLHDYTSKGYRVLAFAWQEQPGPVKSLSAALDSKPLEFVGLIAVADSLRKQAKQAIAQATSAGVTVRMITGDHFETAYHIGKQLGLASDRSQVFDCSQLDKLSDQELEDTIDKIRVFSRVIPKDKHRLLSVLKKHNITAMTGDGVNDVPALTNAHVGIAMGSGTSIAKDAGDIILVDDNFKTIVDAIREGRIIFTNIKLMVAYLLSTNAGEVILNIGALMAGAPIPLLPVQLLWVNLVTDTSMVIPLGLEPGDRDIMKQRPFPPKAPLLARFMIARTVIIAFVVGGLTLGMYMYFLNSRGVEYARTIAFMTIVVIQWSNALVMRSDHQSVWQLIKKPSRA
ncbi:hypothetical protein CR956_01100, partial [Candidatus Saccharibacteria bacterium]